jgi:hypothetical protein
MQPPSSASGQSYPLSDHTPQDIEDVLDSWDESAKIAKLNFVEFKKTQLQGLRRLLFLIRN